MIPIYGIEAPAALAPRTAMACYAVTDDGGGQPREEWIAHVRDLTGAEIDWCRAYRDGRPKVLCPTCR